MDEDGFDCLETTRLTAGSYSSSDDLRPFQIVNKPLHLMNLRTQVQVTSLIKREHLMKAVGEVVTVEFQEGPLGLQLADIGRRVLITAFDKSGQKGQAERCGKLEVGFQVVSVGGRSTLGLPMKGVLDLIATCARPVEMQFQPLIIPRTPSKHRESIQMKLGPKGVLRPYGETYQVHFEKRFLGMNVGNVQNMVVVSQYVDGVTEEVTSKVNLGDQLVGLYCPGKGKNDEWVYQDCKNMDYVDVAASVRKAGRPIRLEFQPMRIVEKTKSKKKMSTEGSEVLEEKRNTRSPANAGETCTSCGSARENDAKFCWNCGFKMEPSRLEQASDEIPKHQDEGDLLSFFN